MTDVNHVVLVGRLTRDLAGDERSFGYTQGGMARANVSIAVNRSRKDASGQYVDEVSYFDVVIWGKTAENLKPYLTKGKMIVIDGSLKQERWQDQNGANRSRVVINTTMVQLCGGNGNGNDQGGYNPQRTYPTAQAALQAENGQPQFQPQQSYGPPQHTTGTQNTGSQQDFDFPEDIPF
jgi:single-strand DNA-binding protein